jgi:hypothetical protein
VALTLGGFVKTFPVEEALMGQAGQSWGLIDYSLFGEVDVVVKIYSEAAKTNFLIGYKVTSAVFDNTDADSFNANDFGTDSVSLVSDNMLVTTIIGNL